MGVVALSRNSVLSSATKHIEIADFFVREMVTRGIITVAHVPTSSMVADVLTKPLAKIKFFRFMNIILGLARMDPGSSDKLSGEPSEKVRAVNGARNMQCVGQGNEGEPYDMTSRHGGRTRNLADTRTDGLRERSHEDRWAIGDEVPHDHQDDQHEHLVDLVENTAGTGGGGGRPGIAAESRTTPMTRYSLIFITALEWGSRQRKIDMTHIHTF